MSIQLTQEEIEYINSIRAAGFDIDVDLTTPSENESYFEQKLPSGRIILAIHHFFTDKITIYKVEEVLEREKSKINNLIETNEQFRSLLNN